MFNIKAGTRFWGLVKKVLASMRYDKLQDIDGVAPLGEKLFVRGRDLTTLIGKTSFTEALFHILLDRMPSEAEREILDAVLVSFHAGFGFSTPSVLLPRLAATTGSSVAASLAAGFSGGGKHHLGATEEAMGMYEDILNKKGADLAKDTKSYLTALIKDGYKIHGFGHPLFKRDPRPLSLRKVLKDRGFTSSYIEIYDAACKFLAREKDIYPNIDGINGAILLSLGFKKDHGTGLFLLSRMSAMLAHVAQERTKEPFYSEKRLYPLLRALERDRK